MHLCFCVPVISRRRLATSFVSLCDNWANSFSEFFFFWLQKYMFKCPRVWWCFVVFQRDPAFWIWGRSRSLHVRVLLFSRCVTTVVTVWFISLVTLCMDVVRPYCSNCCSVVVKMLVVLNLIKSFLILILCNVMLLSIFKALYRYMYKHFDKKRHCWV